VHCAKLVCVNRSVMQIREAARYSFPTGDIGQMLEESGRRTYRSTKA